ncbi:MAG: glycosyltransferase [bacterium]
MSPRKLNIAMICDPIDDNKPGVAGVVMSTLRFSKLLKDRGHKIIFVGAKLKGHTGHTDHDGIKAYRYRSIPLPKSGGWALAFPTISELKKVFQEEKIDVVHLILPMSGSVVAIKAAKALGIPMVAHSHAQPENIFMDVPGIFRPITDNLWNKYLVWLYSKAESLIYPSEMAKALLNKLGKKNQPSTVISNGINLNDFKQMEVGDFYERFNVPPDRIKLLFVGRLFPEKSIDTLIKAVPHIIKDHPNAHVMIAGSGHLRPKLEKLMHSHKVSGHITFLGFISEQDKILAYNACDIFVLPSLAELEGMVVLEAMACGKPILIADAEMSASKYFVDGNGFLFKTKDHADLAHQASKIITDVELRKQMGEKSLKNIQNYDINKSIDLLEEVYYGALLKEKQKK